MTVWEGGHRVVGLAHWPAAITPGVVSNSLVSSLDFFPTVAALADVAMPAGRSFDGIDLSPLLRSTNHTVANNLWLGASDAAFTLTSSQAAGSGGSHTTLFHPLSGGCGSGPLMAMRLGKYKALWVTGGTKACGDEGAACVHRGDAPLLFDLSLDPAESTALDTTNPKYKVRILSFVLSARAVAFHKPPCPPGLLRAAPLRFCARKPAPAPAPAHVRTNAEHGGCSAVVPIPSNIRQFDLPVGLQHSQAVVSQMASLLAATNQDIGSTARSTADYSTSASGKAANCCNSSNVACACLP